MKTKIYLLPTLFCLLLGCFSCQEHKLDPTTSDTCKLSAIDRGNGNKHSYTYNAQGVVTQMAREFDGTGSGKISHYIHTFTYDAAGLITKTTATLEGKPDNSETYTYTNGRISKVTYANVDGSKGTNNIKYNTAGQITEFTYETGDPNSDSKQYFAYNADGVMTETGYTNLPGTTTYYKVVYKPVGKATSPEQLLAKHGLPHDVLTGTSWLLAVGGAGSTYEVFYLDQTGNIVSGGTGKTTAVQTNTKGYVTQISTVDETNQAATGTFTLTDCN